LLSLNLFCFPVSSNKNKLNVQPNHPVIAIIFLLLFMLDPLFYIFLMAKAFLITVKYNALHFY